MKKIILFILALVLTGCNTIDRKPLTAVNNLEVKKEVLYQIDNRFGVEKDDITIFDIDDDYAYIRVHNRKEKKYEFYKLNTSNELELFNEYSYQIYNSNHSLSSLMYNDSLILIFRDYTKKNYQLLLINKENIETLYEAEGNMWFVKLYEDNLIFSQSTNHVIEDGYIKTTENYTQLNLKTKETKTLLSDDFKYNFKTGELEGDYSDYHIQPTYASYDGFIYNYNHHVYFYDYAQQKEISLFKCNENLDEYGMYWGNTNCVMSYYEGLMQFVVKNENNNYIEYYINLKNEDITLTLTNPEFYINDEKIYFSSEDKIQLMVYDYKMNELSLYVDENWYEKGRVVFENNQVYFIKELQDSITIEKCSFN